MKQKSKSKSAGKKTQQSYNQGGHSNESKTFPSKTRSNGVEQFNNAERLAHNSNENAWSRSRHSSVSDMWSDQDEHFPVLGASSASGPKVNVWEERKSKQEAIKALEPQNEFDEEAMLQHALAMSLLEATEEEQRQKEIEEEIYKMQLEALQHSSEDSKDFDAPDEFPEKKTSEPKDDFFVNEQHQLDNYSGNYVSKPNQKEKIYNCGSSKFQDDLSVKEPYQFENYSKDSIPNTHKKEITYNSGGARPKINKTIEAFGGWGLKENKKRNNSEKISEFLNDVVSEKTNNHNKIYSNQKNNGEIIKESINSNGENSFHSIDTKSARKSTKMKKSDGIDEILYDEKGVFIDNDDGKWGGSKNEDNNLPSISPNTVLDTWLSSEDGDDWNNEILSKKKNFNDKKSDNFTMPLSLREESKIEDDKSGIVSTSIESSIPAVTSNYEPKIVKDSQILPPKLSESIKNVWSDTITYKDQELPENTNAYKYDAHNLNANNFTPFHEPTEVPTLTSCKIWSDKSSSDSSYFSSFSDNLASKVDSLKLSNEVDNELLNITPSNDFHEPPIPPPQPPTAVSTMNECSTSPTVISGNDCEVDLPPVPQPQHVPEMQVPQYSTYVNNPILNPMFPAFNPMMGCGMDPLMMRQMLILSNPFLANRLLALEQYYRAMGLPVDLFSMPTPVPNVSGILNLPLGQNSVASNVNDNVQQLQSEIQQLQAQMDATAASVSNSTVNNIEQKSCEKSHETSGLDAVLDFNKSSASVENYSDDPWFKSYLTDDNASVIPPPKPPSDEVNHNNLMFDPQNSKLDQIVSNYDMFAHSHASDNSTVPSSITNKNRPVSNREACVTKKEVIGWSDPEDDFADAQNLKSHTWDDGWGDAIAPPKPHRSLSLQEDKKKAVFRQPAKQPQIGRYQRNFTNS